MSARKETVVALYDRLNAYRFIQVSINIRMKLRPF